MFAGDSFGETDTRFLYCAMNALSLLGRLDVLDELLPGADSTSPTRRARVLEYLSRCRNYDGGFGSVVGAESHAAQGALYECTFFLSS